MTKRKLKPPADIPAGDTPYVAFPGMPFDLPVDGVVKCKAELPFACRRCLYPLQSLQSHTLHKGGVTQAICLGTCLDVIKGDTEAIAELKLTEEEVARLGNVFRIPDHVMAQALNYSLEKGEMIDATGNLAEGAPIPAGPEEAPVLDQGPVRGDGPEPVRDPGPGSEAA